jgi:hypothetical protein
MNSISRNKPETNQKQTRNKKAAASATAFE